MLKRSTGRLAYATGRAMNAPLLPSALPILRVPYLHDQNQDGEGEGEGDDFELLLARCIHRQWDDLLEVATACPAGGSQSAWSLAFRSSNFLQPIRHNYGLLGCEVQARSTDAVRLLHRILVQAQHVVLRMTDSAQVLRDCCAPLLLALLDRLTDEQLECLGLAGTSENDRLARAIAEVYVRLRQAAPAEEEGEDEDEDAGRSSEDRAICGEPQPVRPLWVERSSAPVPPAPSRPVRASLSVVQGRVELSLEVTESPAKGLRIDRSFASKQARRLVRALTRCAIVAADSQGWYMFSDDDPCPSLWGKSTRDALTSVDLRQMPSCMLDSNGVRARVKLTPRFSPTDDVNVVRDQMVAGSYLSRAIRRAAEQLVGAAIDLLREHRGAVLPTADHQPQFSAAQRVALESLTRNPRGVLKCMLPSVMCDSAMAQLLEVLAPLDCLHVLRGVMLYG